METASIVVDFVHAAEWRPKLTPKISFFFFCWTHVDVFMGLAQHPSVRQQKHITKGKEAQYDRVSSLRTGQLMKRMEEAHPNGRT
jgi:hypothetical protein